MPKKRPLCHTTSTPVNNEEPFERRGALESIIKRARTDQHQLSSFRITPTGPRDSDSDMQPDELTLILSLSLRNQLIAGLNRTSEILSGKSATPAERMNAFNENNNLAKRLMALPVYLTSKQQHEQQLNEELDDFLVRNVEQVSKQPEYYHPFGLTGEPETLSSESSIDTSPPKSKEQFTPATLSKKVQLAITDKSTPTTRASARTCASATKDQKATSKGPAKDLTANSTADFTAENRADSLANGLPADLPADLSADLAAFIAEPDEICFANSEIQHRTDQLYPLTGQMSWKMNSMSEFFRLKVGCRSPPIHIRDQDGEVFRFKLWLNPKYLKTKTDNPKSIDLFIECQSPAEQWSCPVNGHLRLVNQRGLEEMDDDDNSMHRLVPIEYTFTQNTTVAGLPNLISYRLLTKPQNGFYLNDSIVFEFEVNIQPSKKQPGK